MSEAREDISKEDLALLVDGKLSWEEVKRVIKTVPKGKDRFWKYLEVLQERVTFKDKILLRLTDHLYIVAKVGGGRVVKCGCGHELGDYRVNWKFNALVRVRKTREEIAEVYTTRPTWPNPEVVEIREYYCPGCLVQHGVEVCPPGYPPIFEALPDLDSFYRDWLGQPLPDEQEGWFEDRTFAQTAQWAAQAKGG